MGKLTRRKQAKPHDGAEKEVTVIQKQTGKRSWSILPTCERLWWMACMTFLFALLPAFLNYTALIQETNQLPASGKKYEIFPNQQMYLSCHGTGYPTVLFEAPTAMTSDAWNVVINQMQTITKVCIYDRAGLGLSDIPPDVPGIGFEDQYFHTVASMALQLNALLQASGPEITQPFIYVGSELGALVVRYFANVFNSSVSHIVLVNPLTEDLFLQDNGIWKSLWYKELLGSYKMMGFTAISGLTRLGYLSGLLVPPLKGQGDLDATNRQKHFLCRLSHVTTMMQEVAFTNQSFQQIRALYQHKPFPSNIHVTFIDLEFYDKKYSPELNLAWEKAVLATRSKHHPDATVIFLKDQDRYVVYTEPNTIVAHLKSIVAQRRQTTVEVPINLEQVHS